MCVDDNSQWGPIICDAIWYTKSFKFLSSPRDRLGLSRVRVCVCVCVFVSPRGVAGAVIGAGKLRRLAGSSSLYARGDVSTRGLVSEITTPPVPFVPSSRSPLLLCERQRLLHAHRDLPQPG